MKVKDSFALLHISDLMALIYQPDIGQKTAHGHFHTMYAVGT